MTNISNSIEACQRLCTYAESLRNTAQCIARLDHIGLYFRLYTGRFLWRLLYNSKRNQHEERGGGHRGGGTRAPRPRLTGANTALLVNTYTDDAFIELYRVRST